MSEKLTAGERATLEAHDGCRGYDHLPLGKALRIIDQQAARIAELEAKAERSYEDGFRAASERATEIAKSAFGLDLKEADLRKR